MKSTTASIPTQRLVFIDSAVEHRHILEDGVIQGTDLFLIDSNTDGIAFVTEVLANYDTIASLHLVSHGEAGMLKLGAVELSLQTLDRYVSHLRLWSESLTSDAEILLYGCRLAADDTGVELIHRVKSLTGAEIAASSHLTGNADQGGDWALDVATGPMTAAIAFQPDAVAAYPAVLAVILRESFRGSDVTVGTWIYGVGQARPGDPVPDNPILTARNGITPSTGGIPGGGTAIDLNGRGALRLTSSSTNQASFVLFDVPIESDSGLDIRFDFFAYDGAVDQFGNGADGISFFLIDGEANPTAGGGFGGSLGYAQRENIAGIDGGYLGIGFDAYGNFSSNTEGRTGGNAPGIIPDSIAVRGSEQELYKYLTGTGSLASLDEPTVGTRNLARRRTRILLEGDGRLSIFIDLNDDRDFNDANENPISNFDVVANNGQLPDTFKFGFAAATGRFTNIHEIQNLLIRTVTPATSQRPTVTNASARLDPNTQRRLRGLSGTDPDGEILFYTILTLPDPALGVLYLNNPQTGGTPVVAGQRLALGQIDDLFFAASANFNQVATFEYNANDNSGRTAAQNGVVTLRPRADGGSEDGLCLRGTPVVGDAGGNRLVGDENRTNSTRDLLQGLGGDDVLLGLLCSDTLDGGDGNDRLSGGAAADLLFGRAGNDLLNGGAGDDTLRGGVGDDTLTGRLGNDLILGGNGRDSLFGGSGNDELYGGEGRDRLFGASGRDTLLGNFGNDLLRGGAGDDILLGGSGNDTLVGGAGNDRLRGDAGNDFINGGGGRDTIRGGIGSDTLFGRSANDSIRGGAGDDKLLGGFGDDILQGNLGNDYLNGGADADLLSGGFGDDTLFGGDGNDRLEGNQGQDLLSGDAGNDLLIGHAGSDILLGKEGNDRLYGGIAPDTLRGGNGSDTLFGGASRDALFGGDGNDVLVGGLGADTLRGGAGADFFVFAQIDNRLDVIADFEVNGGDRIALRQIFQGSQFQSATPFEDYVRLINAATGTFVQINTNGDTGPADYRSVVLVSGVAANSLTVNHFAV